MVQFPRYESYKDSGVAWLGKVPSHWKLTTGRTCLSEQCNKNIGNKEKTVLSLSYGKIVIKPEDKLHGLVPESFETYQIITPGNIIIRSTDLQNDKVSLRVGLVKDKGIITSAYLCLNVKHELNPRFTYYLLHSYDILKVYYGMGSGLRQNLSFTDFKYLPLSFPSLEEQKRIVNFLDKKTAEIDEAIAQKQKLIKLLQEQKAILINRAVTKGLNPNVTMRDSGIEWIGEIPEHWEVKRLKFIAQIIAGQSPHESTYNSVGVGSILVNGPVEFSGGDLGKTVETKWTTSPKKFVSQETLLFCLRGSTTGRLNISHKALSIGRGVAGIIFSPEDNNSFYHYVIWSLAQQIRGTFRGSTFPSITSPQLGNYPVPIVPINEQNQIYEQIKQIEEDTSKVISSVNKELTSLQELNQVLISNAVTGKIKI